MYPGIKNFLIFLSLGKFKFFKFKKLLFSFEKLSKANYSFPHYTSVILCVFWFSCDVKAKSDRAKSVYLEKKNVLAFMWKLRALMT